MSNRPPAPAPAPSASATVIARDVETTVQLGHEGWFVIRVWEHGHVQHAAERTEASIRWRRERHGQDQAIGTVEFPGEGQ
jgi:hypothetical protein